MATSRMSLTAKRWLTDPATYPIVGIVSLAVCGAGFQVARYSTRNPDVCFSKARREELFRFNDQEGSDWRSHRFRLANAQRNKINQSEQFDIAFGKAENASVQR